MISYDRFLILANEEFYSIGASLKDAGNRIAYFVEKQFVLSWKTAIDKVLDAAI